jgi:hypothetical protein
MRSKSVNVRLCQLRNYTTDLDELQYSVSVRGTCNTFDPQALQVKYKYEYLYLVFPFRLCLKTGVKTKLLASNTSTYASCEISITRNTTLRLLKR